MEALQSFRATVKRHGLFNLDHKLLIAVSSGADSIALLHICHEIGYDIAIAHVNYQLRQEDSDMDADFVLSQAKSLGVPVHIKTIDCNTYAEERNLSIQEAARNIRYDFFSTLQSLHYYDHILTAHHANDNVETMIYTISKGASLTGLRGIPISRGTICRPLLRTSQAALDIYMKQRKLDHRHDVSNDSTKYKRNYIRHEVIPKLKTINPRLEESLANSSELADGYRQLLDVYLTDQKADFLQKKRLDLKSWISKSGRFAWLYEMIHHLGFNYSDVLDIWNTFGKQHSTGKQFISNDQRLTIERGSLVLGNEDHTHDQGLVVIKCIETASVDSNRRVEIKRITTQSSDNGTYFDEEKIKFPLTLRAWQPGDKFRPLGMNGKSKKIKDYLTDRKISGDRRKQVEVLLSGDDIIWVVGLRQAHDYEATNGTTSPLSIIVK